MTILRIYIAVLLLLCSLAGGAQVVRPDQFPLQTDITGTNFEVYSQYGGVNAKTLPVYMKEYFIPNVDSSWQEFTFTDSIGVVDSLRMMFLKDNHGRVWYVDADGDALLLRDTTQALGNVYVLATTADTTTVTSPVEGDIAYVQDTARLLVYEAYWLVFSGGGGSGSASIDRFEISGDTLYASITGDGVPDLWVDLESYLDNTDAQTLSFDTLTGILTISGGNIFDLDGLWAAGQGTAGALPKWSSWNTLGNSSLTESGQVLSSSLTGAFKLPAGTDAEDPVWASGMLRYNTTVGGFQGYNGSAERFLPWADADNFTTNRVPYSDGNQLTSDADLIFDGSKLTTLNEKVTGELYVNQDDVGDYKIQVLGATRLWGLISTNGGVSLDGGSASISGVGYNDRLIYANGGLSVRRHDGAGSGSISHNIITYNGNPGSAFAGTMNLNFQSFLTGPESYRTHGRIQVVAGTSQALPNNTYGGDMLFWAPTDSTQSTLDTNVVIKRNGKIYFSKYGDGNITGTPAYSVAVASSGKIIEVREKWGAISTSTDGSGDVTVTHNLGATPTVVLVSPTGTTAWICTVHTIGATTFKVRFFDAAGAAVTSTAVTATWLAKT